MLFFLHWSHCWASVTKVFSNRIHVASALWQWQAQNLRTPKNVSLPLVWANLFDLVAWNLRRVPKIRIPEKVLLSKNSWTHKQVYLIAVTQRRVAWTTYFIFRLCASKRWIQKKYSQRWTYCTLGKTSSEPPVLSPDICVYHSMKDSSKFDRRITAQKDAYKQKATFRNKR